VEAEAVGEEGAAPTAEGVADEGAEPTVARKAIGISAVAAGVTAMHEKANAQAAEIENLNTQIADLNSQMESLNATNAELQAQLDAQTAANVELQAQIDAGQASSAELQAQLDAQMAANAELQTQLDAQTAANAELQAQLSASQAELQELNQQVEATRATLLESLGEEDLPPAEEGEDEERGRMLGLAAVAGGAAAASHRRRSKENEMQAQLASYEQQIEALNAEKSGLDARAQQQTADAEALAAQIASLQGEIDSANAARGELEASLQQHEQSLAGYNDQVLSLQGQVNALAAEKSDLEAAIHLKDEQLAAQEAELSEVRAATEQSMGTRMAGLGVATAGAAAVAALQDKDAQLAQAIEQRSALEQEIEALRAERATLQVDLEETKTRLSGALPFQEASLLSERLAEMPPFKRNAISAAIVAGVQPAIVAGVQSLNDIHGIGAAFQQRLNKSGVGTYWEVACLSNAELQQFLQIPEHQLERIDYDGIRRSAHRWASESDTIGAIWDVQSVDDLESLPGIGSTFEKRLYQAGITTYAQLVAAGRERLAEIVQAPEFRQPDFDAMIEAARSRIEADAAGAAGEPESGPAEQAENQQ
jgi:predicted flap endonuclease-1-like 5' DNA nuclease/septal ring factor EnvC (AmiA/AmiB activator)